MKHKFLSLFIATVAMTILNSPTFASVTINGIAYELNGTTATVVPGGNYTGTIVIPSSVTYNSVTYSVTSIGKGAFERCYSLTSVTIPNSVTSIGNNAFCDCTGLTSVTIGNSVTSIGDYAFYYCSGLTSVTIGNSVTSIGEFAFSGCTGLTSITIPNSVTSIGDGAFWGCRSLTSPVYNAHVFAYMPTTYSGAYTIPEGIESIAGFAFYKCTGLTSITIPNSVTSIGYSAFSGCSGLTSITIPNSVTSIGGSAFYSCSGLTSVTLGNSVTSIGEYAFYGCYQLTSVTIPNSVTSIGENAFRDCRGLTSIYATCGDLERVKQLFNNDSRVKYAPLKYSITCNVNIREAGSVQIPQNACEDVITAIPNYGYNFTQWSDGNTDNPRTIVLTQDTTFTAEFAVDRVGTCGKDFALTWSYDHSTKVLTIGNAGEFTDNMRFGVEAPNEMEELVIGNSVTAIGENAFAGIGTLKKVSIGESVKTIYDRAFYNCVNLETIFNYRSTPSNAYSTAFDGVDKFDCKLYVLPSSIDMYKNASVWRDFYYTYAIGASETTTDQNVTIIPNENSAIVTWPTNNNAATYTLQITKDGVVFCTLIFNGAGQLIGISFAPSRDGSSHALAATVSVAGMSFTVTGLSSASKYAYNLSVADENNEELVYYQGEFATTGYEGEVVPGGEPVTPGGGTTVIDNVNPSTQSVGTTKFFRNGQLFIQHDGKTYTVQGQEVK